MADVQHSSLTGSELHECKGADSASVGQVPVATGSGTAVFAALNYSYLTGKPQVPTAYFNGTAVTSPLVKNYSTVAVAGVWTVSLSGFTTIHSVQATALGTSAGLGNTAIATLNSVSTSSVSGNVVIPSASANALGTTQTVYVTVWGI